MDGSRETGGAGRQAGRYACMKTDRQEVRGNRQTGNQTCM